MSALPKVVDLDNFRLRKAIQIITKERLLLENRGGTLIGEVVCPKCSHIWIARLELTPGGEFSVVCPHCGTMASSS